MAVKGEIIFTVFVFLFYAAADFYIEFWGYGHVPVIEEPVQIAAEKESVVARRGPLLAYGLMWAASKTGRARSLVMAQARL